ncbi:DNA-directed RNA polymerase I subunit RPB5z, putative [Leishmania donovani]|uniref:DNA-directed RNA polymerase I subunit RPB5z, putative n=1 Tax=Leishmania donovani TaxID=5661 RepID=A0A3S5H734_LEIDO|nr:DNA-directed RNA polymerase I subunit RPB5z, putative [Leishmania donovani]
MSSIEELKVVRLFRALNTIIQLCHDRGYVIRHPSAIAEAVQNPELYDDEEGLDHDWFLRHFVISPGRAARSPRAKQSGDGGSRSGPGRAAKNEKDGGGADKPGEYDVAVDEDEVLRRAANGEWVCMRNAMRLTCSVDPRRATLASSVVTGAPTNKAPSSAPVVKAEPKDDGGGVPYAVAAAAVDAKSKEKAAKNALMVFFSGSPKLSIKEVHSFREKALKKMASSMIIVTNKIDPGVRMDVQELSGRMDEATGAELLSIQVFEEEALAFNVVRHETVPRHVALTPAEAEAFLAERKLNVAQLPRMQESDPLVQYLGLQRGSIVHITREGKQSGPYSMYRHVI